jgi:hypothetical protein
VARNIDRLPKTHVFPIVAKLLSAIQADNVRSALDGTEFDRLLLRKRGLSMLTAKNKVEEWSYHPNPQDKFTISIVQAEKSKVVAAFFVASIHNQKHTSEELATRSLSLTANTPLPNPATPGANTQTLK